MTSEPRPQTVNDPSRPPPDWRTADTTALFEAVLALEDVPEAEQFFRDLCTLGELHDLAQRWAVVRLLDEGLHYGEISRRTGASTATITRIASWLHHGEGGYSLILVRLRTGRTNASRTRMARTSASRTDQGAGS